MKNRCVIICASPIIDNEHIKRNVTENDFVICADAGYITAQKSNVKFDLIVGDFDSSQKPKCYDNIIKLPVEKDDTDTFYALKYAINKGYKDFIILGALGGRLDHTFANLSILKYLKDNNCTGVIVDDNTRIYYVEEDKLTVEHKKGKTISVFTFGYKECSLTYSGLKYPLKNQTLTNAYPYGISNIVTSDYATIEVHSGGALVMIIDKA